MYERLVCEDKEEDDYNDYDDDDDIGREPL
jgi:hypothetical protein